MTNKYLKILEFDKIIAKACEFAVCDETKQLLEQEKCASDSEAMRQKLCETDSLTTLLLKYSRPRYSNAAGVKDAVLRATKGGVLSMAELLLVARALQNFTNITSWYSSAEHDELVTDEYFYAITPHPSIEKHIFECILSEAQMADTASDTLYDLRRKIRAAENSIRDKLDSIIKSQTTAKYLQDAVVSIRNGRFVVPVKSENKSELSGVVHDVSSSGATVFVEPAAVVEANAKILQLKNQEQEEIERILAAMSSSVASIEPLFMHSYDAMLKIDTILAKGHLALDMRATKPAVADGYTFNLIRAKHPLINRDVAVPIDIEIGAEYDTLIITGPNTGGKTVTLKTAGLLNTMAQHGYLIPAHETSTVCAFEAILVDIGDEQSIEQSLSTFSGHVKNITEILNHINEKTLVLMDELGAGTDPAEGAALAVAIIEKMRTSGTKIMATTHYAELKIFALDTKGVQNASCEFDTETLRPTYRIKMGVPGKSGAFLISEKLGMAKDVITRAGVHLTSEDRRLNSVLGQLEDMKHELKRRQDEIDRLGNIAKTELEKAQKQREELIKQGELALNAAREKANKLANDVQKDAYALMDELKKLEKEDKLSAQQRAVRAREIAKKESEKLFVSNDNAFEQTQEHKLVESVKVGDEVYVIGLGKPAVVQSMPDRNGMVDVRAGVIKTKVKMTQLAELKKIKEPRKFVPRTNTTRNEGSSAAANAARTASMEINLIGMNVEEAIYEADKFIDNGVLSGQNTLYLIHGKGAGILRGAIHAHLRNHKSVKKFRLGTFGEGEAGVTVLELK